MILWNISPIFLGFHSIARGKAIENENEPSQNFPENKLFLTQSNFTNYSIYNFAKVLNSIDENFENLQCNYFTQMFPHYKTFFERYKAEVNNGKDGLIRTHFKLKKDDVDCRFPLMYSTVNNFHKIHKSPTLQQWCDEQRLKHTIIRAFNPKDDENISFEKMEEKMNDKKNSKACEKDQKIAELERQNQELQKKNRLKRSTSGSGVREFTESQKKRIAGKQFFQCANKPNSKLGKSINYQCPLWQVEERDESRPKGNFGPEGYEIDHIIPVSEEGRSVEENGQALCHYCHKMKTYMDSKQTNEISNLMVCREMDSSDTEYLDFSELEEDDFD